MTGMRVQAKMVSYGAEDGLYYYEGNPFSGVAYTEFPNGSLRSEVEYREGLRWGKSKEWYKDGQLAGEADFFRDVMHGVSREWSARGVLTSEIICEYGITLLEKGWDDEGVLVKNYKLSENINQYQALLHYRKVYGTENLS